MSDLQLDLFIDEIFNSGGLHLTPTSGEFDNYDVESTNQLLIDSQAEEIMLLRKKCRVLERFKPKRKYPPTSTVCCYKKQLLDLSQTLMATATLAHKHIRMEVGGISDKVNYITPVSPKDDRDYPDDEESKSDDFIDEPLDLFLDSDIEVLA